jgi:hypothetical protein
MDFKRLESVKILEGFTLFINIKIRKWLLIPKTSANYNITFFPETSTN